MGAGMALRLRTLARDVSSQISRPHDAARPRYRRLQLESLEARGSCWTRRPTLTMPGTQTVSDDLGLGFSRPHFDF